MATPRLIYHIRTILIFVDESTLSNNLPSPSVTRPSVIVNLTEESSEPGKEDLSAQDIDIDMCDFEEINTFGAQDIQSIKVYSLTTQSQYMEDMMNCFYHAWGKVNLGEEVMQGYIDFAKYQDYVPVEFTGFEDKIILNRFVDMAKYFGMAEKQFR